MKKKYIKYTCYVALSSSLLLGTIFSTACSSGPDIPKMSVSYGPEVGFADGNVNLSSDNPVINISDIKAEVGMNIDYLSGVTVENEADFPDLEIWVDASLVDIFTPGDYKAVYTFVYNGQSVSKEITVTLEEAEPSASDTASDNANDNNAGNTNKPDNTSESETTSGGSNDKTTGNTDNRETDNNQSTVKPTNNNNNNNNTSGNNNTSITKPTETTSHNDKVTQPSSNVTQPTSNSTRPPATSQSGTIKPPQTSTKPTTTRHIITTAGAATESKNIGNYTIELLSGKNITIKNTTAKYIVSTRTDVTTLEDNGKTYRISKLIITYNTGFEQILETVKERIK